MNEWTLNAWLTLSSCAALGFGWLYHSIRWKARTYPPWFYTQVVMSISTIGLSYGLAVLHMLNLWRLTGLVIGLIGISILVSKGIRYVTHDYRRWKQSMRLERR